MGKWAVFLSSSISLGQASSCGSFRVFKGVKREQDMVHEHFSSSCFYHCGHCLARGNHAANSDPRGGGIASALEGDL